jgi:CRISPR-associated protein Cas5d
MPQEVTVRVWGDYACFTRPELKVERMSYPVLTPSAARGILDAILFKPQMVWHVRRITVLKAVQMVAFRRNEIQRKISPKTVADWIKNPEKFEPYLTDSAGREGPGGANRVQRNTMALRDVDYVIHASPLLTAKANQPRAKPLDVDEDDGPDTEIKYAAMFRRRVRKGQCFHRPYFGCREFACYFGPSTGQEKREDWNEKLGLILYDIYFGRDGTTLPGFFEAEVKNGVLHCDTRDTGLNNEAPIEVHGWPKEVVT